MKSILKKYWGYDEFRPFQEKTIHSLLDGHDTLTVLPTGAGKSICFQVPALLSEGMALVVSPLISLMKDQVDGLKDMGIEAEALNSSLNPAEQEDIISRARSGKIKLLYLAPERLRNPETLELLKEIPLSFTVIDEAHCVSEWGHDFREDYRHLGELKKVFPTMKFHAFTATATKQVQEDILKSLKLSDPHINIAPIDRPNLSFRILPRSSAVQQIATILKQHPNEPGIIYCLRRKDVDEFSKKLNAQGVQNVPYHAGLSDDVRRHNQELFAREEINLVVATIAFGMGIDRSNIRFVIHAALPKSLEHYQQETGRAGRDGLPSSCTLLYGGKDYQTWKFLLSGSSNSEVMLKKLSELYRYCVEPRCRHKALTEYFDQNYEKQSCEACDYCLGELEMVKEPLILAQKILSCVLRCDQRFGADHVARVLRGNLSENIQRWEHQNLSTFGLMPETSLAYIRSMIEQLVGQSYLERGLEYATLSVTESGRELLKGNETPILAKPILAKKKKESEKRQRKVNEEEWKNIDTDLFSALRKKRSILAKRKKVPAFIVFGDRTLKDLARLKPMTKEDFGTAYGVGEKKCNDYAKEFIATIQEYEALSQRGG